MALLTTAGGALSTKEGASGNIRQYQEDAHSCNKTLAKNLYSPRLRSLLSDRLLP